MFRVASQTAVGGGHVNRCRRIAEVLRHSRQVLFVLDEGGESWLPQLTESRLSAVISGAPVPETYEGCVVDGYDFEPKEVNKWRSLARTLAAFHDFGEPLDKADVIISAASSRFLPHAGADNLTLTGLHYALVGREFTSHATRPTVPRAKNVLISFGLIDSRNVTGLALEALETVSAVDARTNVTVILGSAAPHLEQIRHQLNNTTFKSKLIINSRNMWDQYREADLVLGAGGTGLLERMAIGAPSISIMVAENQRALISTAAEVGATIPVGNVDDLSATDLAAHIDVLADDHDIRDRMATAGRSVVDGKGAERIVEALLGFGEISVT